MTAAVRAAASPIWKLIKPAMDVVVQVSMKNDICQGCHDLNTDLFKSAAPAGGPTNNKISRILVTMFKDRNRTKRVEKASTAIFVEALT